MNRKLFFFIALVGGLLSPTLAFTEDKLITLNSRAIEIIQKKEGVYFYIYPETIDPINPERDYSKKYKIHNKQILESLKQLILANKEYEPEFKARCLPVWDYGLEFRSLQESHFFLFSFRCNTIRYVNENLFKDFSPQSLLFYKIFKYEIDEKNSILLDEKN
ncbi:MAG: hypothetical protein ACK4UJ_10970 [Leptonema sp. (in: bacteria)]